MRKADAAVFVWDTNTGTTGAQDGPGTWLDAASNWRDETNATDNQVWANAALNTAVFGAGGTLSSGSGQTVTVSGTVNTGGMVFRALAASSSAYIFSGGTISLASGSKISVQDGTTGVAANQRLTFNSVLSGNNITIEKATGASLALVTLAGANTLTGDLLLRDNGGGLFVQANTINTLPSSTLSKVDVGTNVTLVLNQTNANWTVPFTIAGSGAGGRGAIRMEANNATISGAITLAGNATITANTNATSSTINSVIGESGGSYALTLGTQGTGAHTITLGGNNTFTGGLNIDVSDVRVNNAGALNSTTPNVVTFVSSTNAKALSLNGNSVTVGGLVSSGGAGSITVQNNNATAATLTINTAGTQAFGGVLADGAGGGALSVVKNGAGTQSLSGANTFTGGLTLNAGTLNINSATALGATASTFTINGGVIGNTSGTAIVNANNNPITWNGDFTSSLSNNLNLGTGAISLGTAAGTARSVTVNGSALTLSGSISDGSTTTGINKLGTGLLVLEGASTYSGLTTVASGNLKIRNNTALGSTASGTVVSGSGRLQLENNITVTGESVITPYLENVSGSNTWAGTIQGAVAAQLTLDAAAGNLLVSGNVNATSTDSTAHTFNLTGSGTGEVSGVISGTLAFNKTGSGTWILSGNNTYSSVTNVTAGNLQVGKGGVGQTGTGGLNFSGGGLLSGSGTIRGNTSVTSGIVRPGDNGGTDVGTLTMTGNLGFSPATAATVGQFTLVSNGVGDKISVGGSLTLNSNSRLSVAFDPSYTLNTGDSWDLIDWTTSLTTGGFDPGLLRDGSGDAGTNLDLPDLTGMSGYAGQLWQISNFSGTGALTVSIVPEPSRMMLLGAALAAVVLMRRRSSARCVAQLF